MNVKTGAKKLQEVIIAWGRVHDGMVRALLQEFSERKCRGLFSDSMRAAGAEAADEVEKPLRPAEIGRKIMDFEQNWDIRGDVRESSESVFEREITYCPWAHFHPRSCRILAWYMEGFVKKLNANCDYQLVAMMPAGDRTCIWRLELRGR